MKVLIRKNYIDLLTNPATRIPLVRDSLFFFGFHYFGEYFTHQSEEFHIEMTQDLQFEGQNRFLINEMFKESTKTTWAKIAIIWRICTNRNKFMPYVCFDKNKAKGHLFDIALALQTNKKIIEDFGQLFFSSSLTEEKKSEKKSIDEFITENGIKVKAYSTAMSTRGEIHGPYRPDYYTLDDFENETTKKSEKKTRTVINFIDELLSGISADANLVFLCNKISNSGSVAYLEEKAHGNRDFKIVKLPLIKDGKIMWTSKFAMTDQERDRINAVEPNRKKWVFSVEERKRTLGTARFNQEYQLDPISEGDKVIHLDWLEKSFYYFPISKTMLNKITMLDPQSGQSKSSDFYGLCKIGFYPKEEHRYVLRIQEGKASQLEQAVMMIKAYQEDPENHLIGVEKVLNQVAVYQLILDWKAGRLHLADHGINDQDRNIRLIFVEPRGRDGGVFKDKKARLEMFQADFERREIHLHHTMREFANKLAKFPEVDHDDDIDALVYALEYANKTNLSKLDETKYNNSESEKTIAGNLFNVKY